MSSCIKDLHDYELVKKCKQCEIVLLKSDFHLKKFEWWFKKTMQIL